ncbi:MAG: hypothetical protein LJE69_08035 [Thiohalocapsa sp.]|jgi:hypothetical protein|uniref:hypothetical protein n=1 Tax=Thiohalocapsa sp. TaxID=2497641 RepID=UPI0025EF5ADB|nr:hypothetical protein [Thiohalocapsa sp.]MCG6941185.1 hypothetical protein [Thiohalocapsa sp.]
MIRTQREIRTRAHIKTLDALRTATGRDGRLRASQRLALAEDGLDARLKLFCGAAPALPRRLEVRRRWLRHALRVARA